jgi:peptidoglycan-N-acetylmuramic acid deacetylase
MTNINKKKIKLSLIFAALLALILTACKPNVNNQGGQTQATEFSAEPRNNDTDSADVTAQIADTDNAALSDSEFNSEAAAGSDEPYETSDITGVPDTGIAGVTDAASGAVSGANSAIGGLGTGPANNAAENANTANTIITPLSLNEAVTLTKLSNNSKIGWGLGKETDSANRPLDAINAQRRYGGLKAKFIGSENADNKKLYLTFDEGYENGNTAKILDVLKEKGVKAAFFVTYDYCKSEPELVKRMISEGHIVGNHSVTHPSFPDCDFRKICNEIMGLHNYVKDNFGYNMKFIRFPKGEFSEKTLSAAKDLGYTSVFWSFAYADWLADKQPEPAAALEKIKSSLHPEEIVLLHAVSSTNAAILPELIEFWNASGYEICPLTSG